jgi:hypothetical protein
VIIDISELPPRQQELDRQLKSWYKRTKGKAPASTVTKRKIIQILTEKFAVVTLYSYFPALFDHTISIAWELVSNVNATVTMDLPQRTTFASKFSDLLKLCDVAERLEH